MSDLESCPECGSDNIEDFDDGAVCADCGFEGDEAGDSDDDEAGESDDNCPDCGSDNIEDFFDGSVCADCGYEGE